MNKDKLKKSIKYVSEYNEWRRGAEIPQPDPKTLGLAIYDVLVAAEQYRQRLSGEDWKPIETAPNSNGSEVFLAYIHGHGQCVCYKICNIVFNASKRNGKAIKNATHWKPIDNAPINHIPRSGEKVGIHEDLKKVIDIQENQIQTINQIINKAVDLANASKFLITDIEYGGVSLDEIQLCESFKRVKRILNNE